MAQSDDVIAAFIACKRRAAYEYRPEQRRFVAARWLRQHNVPCGTKNQHAPHRTVVCEQCKASDILVSLRLKEMNLEDWMNTPCSAP